MEFALGIEVKDRRLVARVLRQDGEVETVELDELHRRGVPEMKAPTTRFVAELRWDTLRGVDPQPYLDMHGLTVPKGADNNHQMFEFASDRRQFFIPTLVLIRALCRHSGPLVSQMFAPQALDRVSRIDWSEGEPSVEILQPAIYSFSKPRQGSFQELLSWFKCFPSAFRAASSIHQAAMAGAISLILPNGRAKFTVHGSRRGHEVFVTDMFIQSVVPEEAPSVQMPHLGHEISFHARSNSPDKLVDVEDSCVVPRASGSFELTDKEWDAVEPLLTYGKAAGRGVVVHDQRRVLDGLLNKLGKRTPWKTSEYPTGDFRNAMHMFRTLTKRETMPQIVKTLTLMRNGSSVSA